MDLNAMPGSPSSDSDDNSADQTQWGGLTDDLWAHILSFVPTIDKRRNVQRTCKQLHSLLAAPISQDTWGSITLRSNQLDHKSKLDRPQDVQRLCMWVQRRSAGIREICYDEKAEVKANLAEAAARIWHALAGTTSGTGIRLKLKCRCLNLSVGPMRLLQPPLLAEMAHRLVALDACLEDFLPRGQFGALCSLGGLQHLRLSLRPIMFVPQQRLELYTPEDWQLPAFGLSLLRSLWLHDSLYPFDGFFQPVAVAALQQLRALRLDGPKAELGQPPHDLALPAGVLELSGLTRLELRRLPSMAAVPDLRRLPNLRCLGLGANPELMLAGRFNGGKGLTELRLGGTPVCSQACTNTIAKLPELRLLALDFWSDAAGTFHAAALQARLAGRCTVVAADEQDSDSNDWPW